MKVSTKFTNFLLSKVNIISFKYSLLIQGINISNCSKAFIYSNKTKKNYDEINNLSNYLRKNIRNNHYLSKSKK